MDCARRYNRWLLQASKRADYLKERQREAKREQAVVEHREQHAARGAALQQAAWRQRGAAVEERQRLVASRQMQARTASQKATPLPTLSDPPWPSL